MAELAGRLGFGQEALRRDRVGGDFLRQDLDRHVALDQRVVGAVDHAHAAAAEQVADFILAQTWTGARRWPLRSGGDVALRDARGGVPHVRLRFAQRGLGFRMPSGFGGMLGRVELSGSRHVGETRLELRKCCRPRQRAQAEPRLESIATIAEFSVSCMTTPAAPSE